MRVHDHARVARRVGSPGEVLVHACPIHSKGEAKEQLLEWNAANEHASEGRQTTDATAPATRLTSAAYMGFHGSR
jgi:hypothetical protein